MTLKIPVAEGLTQLASIPNMCRRSSEETQRSGNPSPDPPPLPPPTRHPYPHTPDLIPPSHTFDLLRTLIARPLGHRSEVDGLPVKRGNGLIVHIRAWQMIARQPKKKKKAPDQADKYGDPKLLALRVY